MRFAIFKADGTHEVVEQDKPHLDVRQIQQIVAGPEEKQAFFEVLSDNNVSIYLNEHGKFLSLPINETITRYTHAKGMVSDWDSVVGDCLVTGLPGDEDYDTPLSDEALNEVLKYQAA